MSGRGVVFMGYFVTCGARGFCVGLCEKWEETMRACTYQTLPIYMFTYRPDDSPPSIPSK